MDLTQDGDFLVSNPGDDKGGEDGAHVDEADQDGAHRGRLPSPYTQPPRVKGRVHQLING